MKKFILGGAIVALMSSAAFAADVIVPEPQPVASPLLDNTPIADYKNGLSIRIGFGYFYTGEESSTEVLNPGAAWLNTETETAKVNVPTFNVGFTLDHKFEHKPYDGFVDVDASIGLTKGEVRTDTRQVENPNFVAPTNTLLVSSGTPMDPTSSIEDVRVSSLALAVGPTFDYKGTKIKVGPSVRYVNFSGGGLENQIFLGAKFGVEKEGLDLKKLGKWDLTASIAFEQDISGGTFNNVTALDAGANIGLTKRF